MPKRSLIPQEKKALPGYKPMRDTLILVLCGNANGGKIKALLVYRVFGGHNVIKRKLRVMRRANKKAWVIKRILIEWMTEVLKAQL